MKKVFRILTIALVFALVLTTTSCGKKRETYKTVQVNVDLTGELLTAAEIETVKLDKDLVPEDKVFIGLFKDGVLYFVNNDKAPAQLEKGTYEVITMSKPANETETVSLPSLASTEGGINAFSGWYKTAKFGKGERIASVNQLATTNCTELYIRYISMGDACLVALVCIIIVFAMLALLWGIVSLFNFIAPKEKASLKQEEKQPIAIAPKKALTMADITDDDMMAAALVATIDYHNETNENVRVVSIKEIK